MTSAGPRPRLSIGLRPPARVAALAVLTLGLAALVAASDAAGQVPGPAGRIVSVQGTVEVVRGGVGRPALPRSELLVGDTVRTAADGRAALLLADETQVKLNAGSTLHIKAVGPRAVRGVIPATLQAGKTLLELIGGEGWVRTPGRPGGLEVETPVATATIRGTELGVRVGADGARVVVISGTVEVANAFGTVALAPGELGVVRPGQAPAKQVLLNPDDAVQWVLHYDLRVSPRDFPLVGGTRAQLDERLAEAMRAVADRPRDAGAHARLGAIQHDLGRAEAARGSFEDALALDAAHAGALSGLGWLALEEGRLDEAVARFRAVAARDAAGVLGLSLALLRKGDLAGAQATLAEGRRRLGESATLFAQLALVSLLAGDVAGARQAVDEAIRLDPRSARALGLRSNIALAQNRKDEAFDAAQAAVTASSGSSAALIDLSYAHQARFDLGRAIEAARRAVVADPGNARAHAQLARLLMGYSRVEGFDRVAEAWREAREALRLDPRDPVVHSTAGFLLLARNDVDGAVSAFEKALDLGATFGDPYLGLGLAAFRKGRLDEGLEHFQAAVLVDPRLSLAYSYLGKALWDLGRREEALAAFRRARELDPRDPTPDLYEGIALNDLNRPADAIGAFQQSTAKNDNRAVYSSRLVLDQDLAVRNVNLTRSYLALGQGNRSLAKSIQALHEDPQSSSAHLYYGATVGLGVGALQAGLSELLQTRILVPTNYNAFARGTTWTAMLDRPALEGSLTAGGGSFDTLSGDLSLAGGTTYPVPLAGQSLLTYSETDGPKLHNSDYENWGASLFVKWAPDHRSGAYLQVFHSEAFSGDITANQRKFTGVDPALEAHTQSTFLELGYQFKPVPEGNLLLYAQGMFSNKVKLATRSLLVLDPGLAPFTTFPVDFWEFRSWSRTQTDEPFVDFQAAYLHKWGDHQFWLAGDFFFGEPQARSSSVFRSDLFCNSLFAFFLVCGGPSLNLLTSQSTTVERFDRRYFGFTVQDVWQMFPSLYLTAALRYDDARDGDLSSQLRDDYSVWSPQGGLLWRVTPEHTIRLAAFQHFSPQSHTVISPTHVAGFFLDPSSIPGTTTVQYHAAWEAELTPTTFVKVSGNRREHDVPVYETTDDGRRERNIKGATRMGWSVVFEQMLFRYFGVSLGYERSHRQGPVEYDGTDQQFAATANFVYPFGLTGGALRVSAGGLWTLMDIGSARHPEAQKDFWVSAFGVGYEFPDKLGDFSLSIENPFHQQFDFQNPGIGLGLRNQMVVNPVPEFRLLASLRLNF